MAHHLDVLKAEVERLRTVKSSVKTLLNNLSAKIAELKADPVELQALADSLKAENDEIVADVVANTPAENSPA